MFSSYRSSVTSFVEQIGNLVSILERILVVKALCPPNTLGPIVFLFWWHVNKHLLHIFKRLLKQKYLVLPLEPPNFIFFLYKENLFSHLFK